MLRDAGAPDDEIQLALDGGRQPLWARNRRALGIFALCQTQWRWASTPDGARRVGLDYEGVKATAALNGYDLPAALFRDLQHCERAALQFWREQGR